MSVFSSENKGLISIIIPAYNVGKYIEKCLDSIYLQTYQNFEIIVAYDEKSSDNTLQILENYVKIPSLKIYVGRDTGSGDARNRGFRYAKGEFVIFVDGDDEVTPDYLSTMIDILLTHSECNVVICNSIPVNEDKINKGRELAKKSKNNVIIYPRKDLLYKKMWGNITSSPWAYLVRRQYILDNNIIFPPYSHSDDTLYTYKLIDNSEKIWYCTKILYIFIQHNTSITHVHQDYWWRKYDPYAHDMMAYFLERDPEFAKDFEIMEHHKLAFRIALHLSYSDFCVELKKYNITRMSFPSVDNQLIVMLSIVCFNLSKKLYYTLVNLSGMLVSRLWPLAQL